MKKKHGPARPPTEPQLETLRLADLVPHPDQEKSFKKHRPFEREELKKDILANGVKHRPEVMPPGNVAGLPAYTIIAGHTRREILIELGHTTAEVLVRYDLMNATLATVKKLFLTDNGARRQQSRFDQARYAVELFQLEREEKGKRRLGDPLAEGEVRDRLGKIIGVSGRTLGRYLNVLRCPVEIQDAFEAKRIKVTYAERVANLPKSDQERMAARMRAGEDAIAVLAEFFPPKSKGHTNANNAVAAFARSLEAAGANIADRMADVKAGVVRLHEEQLRAGSKLIKGLLQKLDRAG